MSVESALDKIISKNQSKPHFVCLNAAHPVPTRLRELTKYLNLVTSEYVYKVDFHERLKHLWCLRHNDFARHFHIKDHLFVVL